MLASNVVLGISNISIVYKQMYISIVYKQKHENNLDLFTLPLMIHMKVAI